MVRKKLIGYFTLFKKQGMRINRVEINDVQRNRYIRVILESRDGKRKENMLVAVKIEIYIWREKFENRGNEVKDKENIWCEFRCEVEQRRTNFNCHGIF